MKRFLLLPAIALAAMVIAKPGTGELGASAPPLHFQKWIQGPEFKSFEPGKVYVVEFWATWCGPCKVSIPHLNEMSHKYAGKATFLGVSVFENRPKGVVDAAQIPKVEDFVKTMGEKMSYEVAADTETGDMGKDWMRAYNRPGIPSAFIVDQKGRVVYVDHPMNPAFEQSLQEVIAGTFDVEKAKAAIAKEQADQAAQQQAAKARAKIMSTEAPALKELAVAGNIKGLQDKTKEINSKLGSAQVPEAAIVGSYLRSYNEPVYYTYLESKIGAPDYSDPMQMNQDAWNIMTMSQVFKQPNFGTALKLAQAANDKTGNNQPELLDTLALAYFKNGQKQKAIDTENKAISLTNDAELKKQLQESLDKFKQG